jgi:8-oxo-dGTP pyrophosphatase MutT (NUDIX family)/ribosomal protein S18 acetylase RimI-like enzyme
MSDDHEIAAAVAARRPVDDRERTSIAAFLAHLEQLPEPCSERAGPVHVTASAIVVGRPVSSRHGVLLHRHKRLRLWLQPGGHIDDGESPAQAAVREAAEETGLTGELLDDGRLVHVDVHPGPRRHTHLDLRYLLGAPPVRPAPPAGESQDVAWFAWHEAVAIADPGLEGVLRALQPGWPRLRQATHRDAAGMARAYLRSRRFAVPTVPTLHPEREVRRWFADEIIDHDDAWVADLDGTIVGLLVLSAGWIEHLYLDPAWIGRGLGDEMMRIAAERQPGGLQLWTFAANDAAQRFYTRHGFATVEHTDGRGNEERAPDIRMSRT